MANKKISQLPTSTTVTDSDLLIINDNGVTKTATREALLDGITRNVTDSGNDAVVSGDLDVANQITAGGDIFTTGNISFGSLTDHLTGVTVLTMVDSGGGVETFDSSIATSSAIKGYISAQDFGLDSVAVLQLINENPGIDSAGVLSLVTGSDLDMGGNKVLFGNVYTAEGDLPNASTYHGMFAHVHNTGAAYFAHAGNWVRLANNSDLGSGGSGVDSAQVIGILEDGVQHILPSLDSTYDLGSPTQKWKDLYLSGSTINLGNKTISQSGNNLVIGNASAVVATAFIGDGSGLTGISGGGGGLTESDVLDLINQNQQSGGINARAVKILPLNGQVVRYDSDGNEEDTLTFRAVPENGANTLTYKWSVKAAAAPDNAWTVEQDGPSTDFTLADADEPGAEGVKVIKCEMYENTDGTDSAEKAQDIMTVYGLANGFGITGFLTNESHVEPADSTGSLTTAVNDAGGTFKVFLGTNDITTDPAVTFSNPSNSGINVTIDNNGVYALNSSPNADAAFASLATLAGSAVFEANIGSSLIPNSNTDMVIEKKYTIAKSLRGSTGPSGTGVGTPGVDARAVKLVPNNGQVIRYSADGSTETDTLTFTAEPNEAFTGTKTYDFAVKKGGSSFDPKQVQGSSTNFTLADVDEPNVDSAYVVRVQAYEDNVIKARDFVTIYGLADGTSITAFLTNEAHVEGYDSDGNLVDNFDDAGGTFKVFRGTTEITTSCTFSVDTEVGVDVEIGANTGIYVVNGFSATKKGYADFQVSIPASLINGATSPLLIDKRYSISKSGDGSTGPNGNDAITLDLTNENHSITADSAGLPYINSFNGAVTTLNIFKGSSALSVPSGDISVTPASSSSGVTYSLSNGNKTLTVTGMASNVDEETLTFSISGSTEAAGNSKVFSLTKVKDGQSGDPATVYRLITSSNTVVLDSDGTTFRPSSLSLSQQRVIGNQTPTSADYGRIRARITNNGTTGSFSALTDDVNGVATYNLATGDELIELEMQVQDDNSNWVTVDEESIPVISDASSGEGGRGPGTWWIYIGTSTSSQPTTSGQADTAWTNHAPAEAGSPVEGDQAWFYTGTGEAAAPTSQTVWLRGASSWEKQEKVIRGDLLVDGTVTADQFATSADTDGQTIIKSNLIHIYSIAGSTRTLRVALGDLSVGALDANGNEV